MARIVSKERVAVPVGYFAYLTGEGYVEAVPRKGVSGSKKRLSSERVVRREGHMYYVKNGDVYEYER